MAHKTLPRLLSDDDLLRDSFADLGGYPDVSSQALCRRARLIGLAGEALVDSILLRHGLFPSPVPEGSSSDRLIPLSRRAARLQVKTRTRADRRGYEFRMKKGYRGSPAGCRDYDPGDFDIAALVALPINVVMFTTARASTLFIPTAALARLAQDPLASLDAALRDLDLRNRHPSPGPGAA